MRKDRNGKTAGRTSGLRKALALLAALPVLLAAGCGGRQTAEPAQTLPGENDLARVKDSGRLLVGITEFAPMDYRESGRGWTGFDAELAKAFAEKLGVQAEFVEIDWEQKTALLREGKIDCIWNGMTRTAELEEDLSCSRPYLVNAQVIVMENGDLSRYAAVEDCQHLLFAVEAGGAGEELLRELKYRYTAFPTQREALQSVRDGRTDAAVTDLLMAACNTGEGSAFAELGFQITLNEEVLCVGFRKDSALTAEADAFLQSAEEDGTIAALAERYRIAQAAQDVPR